MQEDARHAEEEDRSRAHEAVDVAPVPDLVVVVPEPGVEDFEDDVARAEFEHARHDGGDEEDQERILADRVCEAEHKERAEAVDRDPRAECRAALDPHAEVEPVEYLFVDEAEQSAKCEHEHQQRDLGLEGFFGHVSSPRVSRVIIDYFSVRLSTMSSAKSENRAIDTIVNTLGSFFLNFSNSGRMA